MVNNLINKMLIELVNILTVYISISSVRAITYSVFSCNTVTILVGEGHVKC